nr:uncharacterized protein LOC117601816 [Osmia lignaria]
MEEVTKCRYIDCVDTREKEQILHELPVCDTGLCVRWLINSGHVDLIGRDLDALRSMKFFVCNNHFTEDCYLSKGTLKENAVPFPHWSAVSRTLKSLKTRRKVQVNGQESSMEEVSINQAAAEKNAPSEFDVDQWCRTCATKKQNLVSMTSKGKGTDMSLLSKLKLLIEIDDEDALPTKMCDECVDKLEQSFKFFQQIYVADNTLRHVFPNSRSNSMPKKPLYSLSEHMRREQREKEEKEKEKEVEQQDRAPRITRGIFRRGRGRPRSRGLGGRGRGRQRSGQVAMSIQSPISSPMSSRGNNAIVRTVQQEEEEEEKNRKNEYEIELHEDERQGDTVFSLLTDTCRSDEELDWSDVLKVMNHQRYRTSEQDKSKKLEKKTRLDEKMEEKVETKIETKVESSEAETTLKVKTEWSEQVPIEEQRKIKVEREEVTEVFVGDKIKPIITEEKEVVVGRIRCEFCEKELKFRRQLQTHLLTDHSELSEHMCVDCLACYESEPLLAKHRSLIHVERRYRCEHCQEEFPEKRVLKEHITTRHSCDLCGVTTFTSKEDLSEHVKSHREVVSTLETITEHSKEVDSETISSPKSVGINEGEGEGEEEKSSAATIIDSASDEKNVNPDPDPVPVPVPDLNPETASSIDRLKGNVSEDLQGEGESVACPDCNEQMQNTLELSIHRMRRHSVNRKDASCLLCDNKSFRSSEEYEQHVLDHCKRLRISPR